MTVPVLLGVLGHPFGRVPPSKPFDANLKEAEVILADPVNPVGKDLIAGKQECTWRIACTSVCNIYQLRHIHGWCVTTFPR